jgi:hypothetical protein
MPIALVRLGRAGVATALVDGTWGCALTWISGSTLARFWQGIASTLLGRPAFDGGARTVLLGMAMHVGVAFGWSAVFLALHMRSEGLRRRVATRAGILQVAAVYGPCIWMVMSLLVIPALLQRPPNISGRWWIQLAGHVPFVGIPIVASVAAGGRASAEGGTG